MKKEKKVTLYRLTYSGKSQGTFKVNIEENEFIEKEDRYLNEHERIAIDKNDIGKISHFDCSMWSFDKDVEHYIDALIERREEMKRESDRLIKICKEYKKTITTEEKKKVKLYCFVYSLATGFSSLTYDADEYTTCYSADSRTIIDKKLMDEIINNHTGSLAMYSLNGNKEAFMERVFHYIKSTM